MSPRNTRIGQVSGPDPRMRSAGSDVYHAPPWNRMMDPAQIGAGDSAAAVIARKAGGLVRALSVQHPYCDETSGLCTVHINVEDVPNNDAFEIPPNGKLIAHVEWWTGRSGGACDLDITGGAIFTVAGTNRVQIDVEQVSSYEDTDLVAGNDLKVQAQAAWGGQAAPPRPAYMTGLIQQIVGGIANNSLPIPQHAQTMYILSDVNTTAQADLLNVNAATIIAKGVFPRGVFQTGKIPILAGMRFYNVTATADCNAFAIFEMVI